MVLRVIVVDDERLALEKMEKLLTAGQYEEGIKVTLSGVFQDPFEAIGFISQETVDLAFLEVRMPEIDGFELAERLQQIQPNIRVVFVTAYQEYAIKAFEMNAFDYLMKPVHGTRLSKTLKRAVNTTVNSTSTPSHTVLVTLCCLQNLHYIDLKGNVHYFSWKTLKAPELFAYLVYHRGKTVNKQLLIDLLWPEYDVERATAQLYTAIYQIRKVIKAAELDLEIKYKDEGYRMVWGALNLDVDDWERDLHQAGKVTSDTLDTHLSIKARYTGDFLEEHLYSWASCEQERIRLIWLDHVKHIANYYILQCQYTEAILLYQEVKEKMPDLEEGYFGLMKIYAMLSYQVEVQKQYRLLLNKFKEEFDVPPSKEITNWYEQWMSTLQQIN
ncbi:response regulator [Paenibacillus dakarensis]|uniref:response regulator n=1 Tax=Paenibacillus dakarensis TaxID=1527293 RepID=UPI0006D53E41|nr:response regulator [Paenibacillus dakarensis]